MTKSATALVLLFLYSIVAAPVLAQPVPTDLAEGVAASPLVVENSVIHVLRSDNGRRYPIWVDVPPSYAASQKPLPVVFVTDAGFSFPIVRAVRHLVGQGGRNIEDFILVGLAPQEGLSSGDSRSLNYTPSNPLPYAASKSDYAAPAYGEAAAYRGFLKRRVMPFIASRYRADLTRTVYLGHSYGGLFGSFVLLTEPRLFGTYVLGSPSLWFNDRELLKGAPGALQRQQPMDARVRIYAGGYETPGPSVRHYKETDMVKDVATFAQLLRRSSPKADIQAEILAGEDHVTVFPTLVVRGLIWALPGRGPYSTG